MDKLRAEYQALETQKKELTATYKSCEKEVWDLKRKQENLNRYLGRTQTDPVQEQQTKTTAYKPIGGRNFRFSEYFVYSLNQSYFLRLIF